MALYWSGYIRIKVDPSIFSNISDSRPIEKPGKGATGGIGFPRHNERNSFCSSNVIMLETGSDEDFAGL